jgi:hypothetical protein
MDPYSVGAEGDRLDHEYASRRLYLVARRGDG